MEKVFSHSITAVQLFKDLKVKAEQSGFPGDDGTNSEEVEEMGR